MNPHHLELFYFVAKYEGITEAVRKMPYGIQQPAVSGQILQLEKSLDVKLFRRRPFALTPAGQELYDFIAPFYSQLGQVAERIQNGESHHLRLGASATILTHHLPSVLKLLRKEFPDLTLTLREHNAPTVESALQKQEIDVALSVVPNGSVPGVKVTPLVDIPLAILAPAKDNLTSFDDIKNLAEDGEEIPVPLLSLPRHEPLAQLFQQGLVKSGLRWEPKIELTENALISKYVEAGFGLGVVADVPGSKLSKTLTKIPLPAKNFPMLPIGVCHSTDLKPVAKRFIEIVKAYGDELGRQTTGGHD
ncbi:MAG: LysR family transcriptional regulator [Verrucomicrobiota bacterium]